MRRARRRHRGMLDRRNLAGAVLLLLVLLVLFMFYLRALRSSAAHARLDGDATARDVNKLAEGALRMTQQQMRQAREQLVSKPVPKRAEHASPQDHGSIGFGRVGAPVPPPSPPLAPPDAHAPDIHAPKRRSPPAVARL
jgi:hypothetical protein